MLECDVLIREYEVEDYDRVRDMITSGLREAEALIVKAQVINKADVWAVLFGLVAVVGFIFSIDLMSLAAVSFLTVFIYYVSGLLYMNFYRLPMELEDINLGCPIHRYEKFWVAEVGSPAKREIVGSVALRRAGDSKEYKLELKRMSVDKKYRRGGTASLLLRKALDYSLEKDAKEVVLTSSSAQMPAIHLYSKFGFKIRRIFTEKVMFGMIHVTLVEMSHTN